MSTNHNSIYKVYHLTDKKKIKSIYVFYGNNLESPEPEELFKRDPKNQAFIDSSTGLPIFNDSELAKILDTTNPISVKFLKQQIHFDDSIGTIKLKIIQASPSNISIEQIYLFCMKETTLNPVNIYQILTQKNKLELTRIRLEQFLLNIQDELQQTLIDKIPMKETYSYDDIMELNLTNKKYIVSKVLGQKFFIVENEYPFVCNPFDTTDYDPFIERAARKSLTTLNSHLLLNSGKIIDNNIYLCLAEDVLKHAKDSGISENTTTSIYYPFLFKQDINTYDKLEENKYSLLEENKKLVNKNTIDTFESINLLYDINKYKKDSAKYKYKTSGVKFIKLTIRPEFSIKIPLDVIFKLIHATDVNPLIKYNPSVKLENIYRLYADKISTDGRKIPFLDRATIFKLMRDIGKTKTVAVYINESITSSLLVCEFEESGNINISGEFEKITPISDIDLLIKKYINPVIQEVQNYLEQSGYKIKLYENIYNENVDVRKLDYHSTFEITKQIKLNDFIGCITSVFIVETKDLKAKTGINMRFKRVSNFNKYTSQEAFVVEQASQKDGLKGDEIVLALIENYRMQDSDARSLVAKLASELQVERGVKKRDIEIKSNPGFKVNIKLNKITSIITITVENINDIYYLDTIPIYLDSLIRLTQDKSSTIIPVKRINSLCSTEERVELVIEDIISPSEEVFPEQEVPIIEGDDLEFDDFSEYIKGVEEAKPSKVKSALDLIYGDDEEDYEEDEDSNHSGRGLIAKGGQSSSDDSDVFVENMKLPSSSDDEPKAPAPVAAPVAVPVAAPLASKALTKKLKIEEDDEDEDKDKDESIKDIVGMRLKNPNPFAAKMYESEPILFLKEDKGKFGRYSRICSSSAKKQPILITEDEMSEMNAEEREKIFNKYIETNGQDRFDELTQDEKDKLIEKDRFLRPEDIIKYGTNPDNKYYYICPRYWCLKTNRPIDPKEMIDAIDPKTGKKVKRHPTCGGIIPDDQTEIKNDGNYVYEFFDKQEHISRENYKKHYPGFMPSKKHPDGLCIPCCFAKWNTPKQLGRRQECAQQEEKEEESRSQKLTRLDSESESVPETELMQKQRKKQPLKSKKNEFVLEKDNYVKGPEKFPLDAGRWGYLPVSIQLFFQDSSTTCQISKTNTNLKLNHTCLLRHGVEVNEKQSFLACIADAKYYSETSNIPSIKEFKKTIINLLTIDEYITYQNGNNVSSFMIDDPELIKNVDINKYSNSNLYKKVYAAKEDKPNDKPNDKTNDKTNDKPNDKPNDKTNTEDNYFRKVAASLENFIKYLSDNDEVIDYTYLWDIICRPNSALFQKGINLIIMEIVNNDSTNNVELICPSNSYSNELYNPSKDCLIIVKDGDLYEPIYAYKHTTSAVKVVQFFNERNTEEDLSNVRDILTNLIKPILRETCSPLPSMPIVYKFKQAILLPKLINLLHSNDYEIEKQIMNYQSKVIGLYVKKDDLEGYIPCYPSAMDPTYQNVVFMNDESLYSTYEKTIKFLTIVSRDTNGEIPSKPEFKVLEDEHIVGVLTETNQFIQLSQPKLESDTFDGIPILNDNNYVVNKNSKNMISTDAFILSSNETDTERTEYIKKIKLETNFFNSFRNTIRILLNDYENIKEREKVENQIKDQYVLYSNKLHTVISLLKELVNNNIAIIFTDSYDYKLIDQVYTCTSLPKDKCNANKPVCTFVNDKKCQLVIPKQNLLNGTDNEKTYYGKMADELIRYSRIRTFIFQPQTYLSFGTLNYNLRENEIIVIHSLLTKDYFEGLVPAKINKYVKYNTFDTTEPKITQVYDNTIAITKEEKQKGRTINLDAVRCEPDKTNISSKIWKDKFPSGFKEQHYGKENCGFLLITDIIKNATKKNLTTNDIKRELIEEYSKYFVNYAAQILDILILEGKKTQGIRVKNSTLSFPHFIYSDDYFVTNLDIWLMMNRYKVPSIIIASKPIILTNREKTNLVLYGAPENKFIFIYAPALRAENMPKYSFIISPNGNNEHLLSTIINEDSREELRKSIISGFTLDEMFKNFKKNTGSSSKNMDEQDKPKKTQKLAIMDESDEGDDKTKTKKQKPKKSQSDKAKTKKQPILTVED